MYGGGLGNNIWEYMSLFAILHTYETEFNLVPHIPQKLKESMSNLFEMTNILEIPELPPYCLKDNSPNLHLVQLNETFNASRIFNSDKLCVVLAPYSAKYENVIEYGFDNIKDELRFHQEYIDYSYVTLQSIKKEFNMDQNNVTFVGMHYRGTDYWYFLKQNYNSFNDPPNYVYYLKAMDYFKNKFQNVIFILITIDFKWLQENHPFLQNQSNLIINPNNNDAIRDLILLSYCNHSIISYGTYGTSAALFSGGITFVYDLGLALDHRGPTIAAGISNILPQWYLIK
ncbi:hypothetical protein ILUMI_16519 [Ignelater luminosus]|uniref:L-Fucosyltransferase n=1 Tax=Ignelater luminosus TaxID=2038154 RepID=A0A8K0CNF5_IGNLU|nr:hypothetical protein ILUMI_16519 [Ignelater luminosus]